MGYDRGDCFPFDSEPNGFPFGSKPKGKLSPRSYPIQCERKWKFSSQCKRFGSNGNPFGSKSEGKLSPRTYPIQCERNWKCSFLSV